MDGLKERVEGLMNMVVKYMGRKDTKGEENRSTRVERKKGKGKEKNAEEKDRDSETDSE